MISTHDLRDALVDQERHAPSQTDILAELAHSRRPHRRPPLWSAGLLAAAAVVAIVGVGAFAIQQTATPTVSTVVTPAATTGSPATANNTLPMASSDPSQVAEQQANERSAEQQAQQAERSAENAAAAAAAQVSAAVKTCTNAQTSTHLVNGHLDATRIAKVTAACARAYGAQAGYTAQWVQTTAGALSGLINGQPQRDPSPVVVVQIHGALNGGGQNGETEALLLILPLDGTLPPASMTTSDAINLAELGAVHRI